MIQGPQKIPTQSKKNDFFFIAHLYMLLFFLDLPYGFTTLPQNKYSMLILIVTEWNNQSIFILLKIKKKV